MKRFCMAQNIRALIVESIPDSMDDIKDAFIDVFEDDKRGSLMNDILACDDAIISYTNTTTFSFLDDATYDMLKALPNVAEVGSRRALLQQSITFRGLRYSVHGHSKGDSYIVHGDLAGVWYPARIEKIIVQTSTYTGACEDTVAIVVENFRSLENHDAIHDPFRSFACSDVTGQLFYRKTSPPLLLDVRNIICHHAHTVIEDLHPLPNSYIHALPLDRVRILIFVVTIGA